MRKTNILEVLRTENIFKIMQEGRNPDILYNFSENRWNLLEWYPFRTDGNLLQLGCGYGALTGLFVKKLQHVTNITNNEEQYEVNKVRFAQYNGVSVEKKHLEEVNESNQFDYVYLECGYDCAWAMLEAGMALDDLLKKVKGALKPEGELLLAINNRNGISYLSGEKDFYEDEYFQSVEPTQKKYYYSKEEIENTLKKEGFRNLSFYFPMPNYRFPLEIYSELWMPQTASGNLLGAGIGEKKYDFLNEKEKWRLACEEGKAAEVANSFLIQASF